MSLHILVLAAGEGSRFGWASRGHHQPVLEGWTGFFDYLWRRRFTDQRQHCFDYARRPTRVQHSGSGRANSILLASLHKAIPPIVCASYADGLGVPAIFPKHFFKQLMALKGDMGANQFLQQNPLVSVPLANAAIDIDTRDQWAGFSGLIK